MQRTWKVSAGEVKLGVMGPDTSKLGLHFPRSITSLMISTIIMT